MTELFYIKDIDPSTMMSERNRVLGILMEMVPGDGVMEVGSSAVKGAIGKQDIDFLVRVNRDSFAGVRALLDARFDRNPNQLSNDEYQGYRVESPLDVAVQLTIRGGQYDHFDRFLDALRADPCRLEAYNALKRQWNGKPMDQYRLAKRAFIELTLDG